jgi:hypothetical protein
MLTAVNMSGRGWYYGYGGPSLRSTGMTLSAVSLFRLCELGRLHLGLKPDRLILFRSTSHWSMAATSEATWPTRLTSGRSVTGTLR